MNCKSTGDIDFPIKNDFLKTINGNVELKNVSFGYRKNSNAVVSDISIDIECGSSVAIVGKSGSGKSTIINLISGLYTPWNGEIKYDNINIKALNKETKSVNVSVVSQSASLFPYTIKENIKMFNESISEVDMVRAAKDACIHDEILNKRGGYNYPLSENGSNLSGGQRQRLMIARALASNPAVLIMDEATSSIDADTEKEILKNIKRRGCTFISAAHRLSAIKNCDRIIVISNGKIVGEGTHSELYKSNEYYQKLIKN
jgi:ABC-type bacteriocin/lantibiotic exporter with double-glycine peptidase domain